MLVLRGIVGWMGLSFYFFLFVLSKLRDCVVHDME